MKWSEQYFLKEDKKSQTNNLGWRRYITIVDNLKGMKYIINNLFEF